MINPKLYLSEKIFSESVEQFPTRNGYGEGLILAGEKDERVVLGIDAVKDTSISRQVVRDKRKGR